MDSPYILCPHTSIASPIANIPTLILSLCYYVSVIMNKRNMDVGGSIAGSLTKRERVRRGRQELEKQEGGRRGSFKWK